MGSFSRISVNNAHIIIDPDGVSFNTIIDEYSSDGVTATFQVQDAMPSISPAPDFVILPHPSQTIDNESSAPLSNSGRFFGFIGEENSNLISHNNVREKSSLMENRDLFYIWIKRSLISNKKKSNNTGAILVLKYRIL